MNQKTKRLLDAVLEKLNDPKFVELLKSTDNSHKAIFNAIQTALNEGYEVIISKKDLSAISAIDVNKFKEAHSSNEPPFFGLLVFGPTDDDDDDDKDKNKKNKK